MNKTHWGIAIVLASALLSASAFAQPGYMGRGSMMEDTDMPDTPMMGGWGPGYGMGMGMGAHMGPGMGMHMGPGMGMGAVWSLNLSDDQRKKVRDIYGELRKKHQATRDQIDDESDKLWDLYGQDKRDAQAIGKVYAKMFDMQRQMIEEQITAQNKVEEVLTKEQRQQLRQTAQRWRWQRNP